MLLSSVAEPAALTWWLSLLLFSLSVYWVWHLQAPYRSTCLCVRLAACVSVSVCVFVFCTVRPSMFVQPHSETLCVCVCVCACVFLWFCVSVSSAGCISGCEFPFPVSSPGAPPLPDDLCVVFVVELDKGPYGLGMGLIDGLVSRKHISHYILPVSPGSSGAVLSLLFKKNRDMLELQWHWGQMSVQHVIFRNYC